VYLTGIPVLLHLPCCHGYKAGRHTRHQEEYIWRRLVELEVVSYRKDDRTAHKRPDHFLLLASPITIGTELENKKKQLATDDGSGDMLEPIPLDVKIDDSLPGE
jgi:hypothetical protein